MKRLLLIILIITLPLIAFFQFKNYRRFHPPVSYEYVISDNVDANYHDQAMVDEYYRKAVEIGAFARMQWKSNDFDVRFPSEENQEEVNASRYYNQLISRVSAIEAKLEASNALKEEGYSNEEIQQIESGISKNQLQFVADRININQIAFGDQSSYVWKVQKQLISKGYEHRLDGLFGIDTQNALTSFQQDNQLYPSGLMNDETFDLLFMN